jgi:hypothetical protein
MLFALVILSIYIGCVEAVYGKRPQDRGLSDGAEAVLAVRPMPNTVARRGSLAPSLSPLPDIPEFYLRPELIPIKERDDTLKIADRFVRSRH